MIARCRGVADETALDLYRRDGCLVIEDFVSAADCDALSARAVELVDRFDADEVRSIFSARDQTHAADRYFRESGDRVRFFFEPNAFDRDGALRQPKNRSINKIGHALHDLDPLFSAFSRSAKLAALAAALGVRQPLLLQSMLIFKQPRIGDSVSCHQDSTFLYTEPLSCVGFWFALEDATLDNGCLWAIPGRHPLRQRFRYRGDDLVMETLDDTPWDTDRAEPLEVAKGSVVILHGLLPHFSSANRSSRSRRAYTLHLIDGAAHYPDDNWLRRAPQQPLRGFETSPTGDGLSAFTADADTPS